MSEVSVFNFESNEIRTLVVDGEPWFVGKDVAEVLGYSDTSQAIRTHTKANKSYPVELTGQVRHIKIIPERDVYRLIMRSKLPAAEQFEEWVVGEVLPSIRKTGSYSIAAPTDYTALIQDPNFINGLVLQIQSQSQDLAEKDRLLVNGASIVKHKNRVIKAMEPHYNNSIICSQHEGLLTMSDIADNFSTSATEMNKVLRENEYLNLDNTPSSKIYRSAGFKEDLWYTKTPYHNKRTGKKGKSLKWTAAGEQKICEYYLKIYPNAHYRHKKYAKENKPVFNINE